jgi:hypothetical protein
MIDRRPDLNAKQSFILYNSGGIGEYHQVTYMEIYAETACILKSLGYAVKHRFRRDGIYFDINKLPLPSHLRSELQTLGLTSREISNAESGDRFLEMLMSMFQKRCSALDGTNVGLTYPVQDSVVKITEFITEIFFYRNIWRNVSRLIDILAISGAIYLIYLP